MMRIHVEAIEGALRLKNRLTGVGRHSEPLRHFGRGGVAEAEESCAEANRDFLAFVRPPEHLRANGLTRHTNPGRGRAVETFRFDSPLPSGRPNNDRVQVRLHRPANAQRTDRVALFHHPIYQRSWRIWEWFLADLMGQVPVAMMAGPYHYERVPPGEYAGESVCNPNPWRLFEATRQWCWDQRATVNLLQGELGLRLVAVVGFSIGAFQSLLAASAGALDAPLVSIASTNRYAYGVVHGVIGQGIYQGMLEVGIDEARLVRMTESIQLERHVERLRGRRVLYIDGIHDRVDPPPSLDRLRKALNPCRELRLAAGHATLVLHRSRIARETRSFLVESGVL